MVIPYTLSRAMDEHIRNGLRVVYLKSSIRRQDGAWKAVGMETFSITIVMAVVTKNGGDKTLSIIVLLCV